MDCAIRSSQGAIQVGHHEIALRAEQTPPIVMVVGGTRPEAVKLAPIVRAMRDRGRMSPELVGSGQHETMFEQTLTSFAMRPDTRLHIERATGSQPELLGQLLRALDNQLAERQPAAVVVQGDTTTALAGALAAFWRKIPVVHVEAGLRSHDLRAPFPEEANRKLIAQLSTLHLAPTARAVRNLRAEGIRGPAVLCTGNTVVDAVLSIAEVPTTYADSRLHSVERRARTGESRLLLATMHRRESMGLPLSGILAGLRTVLETHPDTELVLPMHPNPEVRKQVMAGLSDVDRVYLTAPLHYAEFCRLLSCARLVLSDSGGVQEEAPSFGVPVLVLREVTERVEAVEAGCAILAGSDPRVILDLTTRLLSQSPDKATDRPVNPFGDGHAGERAEEAIAHLLGLAAVPRPAAPQPVLAQEA